MDLTSIFLGISSFVGGVRALKKGLGIVDAPRPTRREGTVTIEDVPSVDGKPKASSDMKVQRHTVGTIDERVGYIIGMIKKGRLDPRVRSFTVKLLSQKCGEDWCVPEKSYKAEVRTIYNAVREHVRYVRDTYGTDLFQHPNRTLEFRGGDCFPVGTMVVTRDGLEEIQNLDVGDEIHDGTTWVKVLKTWARGPKEIVNAELNNGCHLRLSGNHKILLVINGKPIEKKMESVVVGDLFLQPGDCAEISSYRRDGSAKVKSITVEDEQVECVDIMTESGRVYLPGADVTTLQCDDFTIVLGSMLQSVGYPVACRVIRTKDSQDWNHIYLLCAIPPKEPPMLNGIPDTSKWVPLDASVPAKAGWQAPKSMVADYRDFLVK